MNIRTLCLAILSVEDATGYEIRKSSMEGKYSYFVDASYGAIYPALNRLESDGCVTCRQETLPGNPPRKVYSIAAAGVEELVSSLSEIPQKDIFKSEFLLIAMCASKLPRSVMEQAIAARQAQLRDEIAVIESVRAKTEEDGTKWVCDYGTSCLGASLHHLTNNMASLLATCKTDDKASIVAA